MIVIRLSPYSCSLQIVFPHPNLDIFIRVILPCLPVLKWYHFLLVFLLSFNPSLSLSIPISHLCRDGASLSYQLPKDQTHLSCDFNQKQTCSLFAYKDRIIDWAYYWLGVFSMLLRALLFLSLTRQWEKKLIRRKDMK